MKIHNRIFPINDSDIKSIPLLIVVGVNYKLRHMGSFLDNALINSDHNSPRREKCGQYRPDILNNPLIHVSQAPIEGYLGGTLYSTAYSGLAPLLTLGTIFATMRVGAEYTFRSAVAIPTASGNFSCLIVFYGWGAPNRKAGGMTDLMYSTPRPPYALNKQNGGYQSRSGDLTMSKLVPMSVDFHGTTLSLINKDKKAYVAIKPICEALTIDHQAQYRRIERNPVLKLGVAIMAIPSNGGNQDAVCLPLSMLNGWLFGINANRVKNPEIRQKLIEYQFECYDVLNNYWNGKTEPKKEIDAQSLLKTINESARVLITFDVSSGKQHVAALPEHIKMVDTHSESQILRLINGLDRAHFPMILDQVIQYFKECEKDYHRVQWDLYQLRNAQKREVVCTSQ